MATQENARSGPALAPPGAKKRDYWWTVLATDPVALPMVRFLATRRWLSPDQITGLGLLFGLSVGPVFALGTRASSIAGAVLFYCAFLFDCMDGKLARTLGVSSARGDALDHLADGGRRASASLGMMLWLWQSGTGGDAGVLWAAVYAVLAYYFIEISGAARDAPVTSAGARWSGALGRHRLLPTPGMPDVQAVVFIIGPLTGLVVPAFGVGIAMVVTAILITVRRRLKAPREVADYR